MDRNLADKAVFLWLGVALRKESVDRNSEEMRFAFVIDKSLSARRAWIEIDTQNYHNSL